MQVVRGRMDSESLGPRSLKVFSFMDPPRSLRFRTFFAKVMCRVAGCLYQISDLCFNDISSSLQCFNVTSLFIWSGDWQQVLLGNMLYVVCFAMYPSKQEPYLYSNTLIVLSYAYLPKSKQFLQCGNIFPIITCSRPAVAPASCALFSLRLH